MKKTVPMLIALSVLFSFSLVSSALAARPSGGGKTKTPIGYDVSWPQCGSRLPTDHAFGIVGVNGGKATTLNPCLGEQLVWAHSASGLTSQPKAQLYVNTANPGEVRDIITTWPSSTTDVNPYGSDCTPLDTNGTYVYGANNLSCSWQYGWDRAVTDVQEFFIPTAQAAGVDYNPLNYVWWLDVETMNTWQSGSAEALARNVAALEGMTAYFESLGAKVGIYSTNYQWGLIVGDQVSATSNLNGLDSWLAGASSLRGAQANCSNPPLTAGSTVTLAQYVSKNLDHNYSCQG